MARKESADKRGGERPDKKREQRVAKKDLDVKNDKGKDVKGGGVRAFSDARLKHAVRSL